MKIAIACDHVGYAMKLHMIDYLNRKGHTITDVGTNSEERCDYPVYGKKAADLVAEKACDLGILICGTGVGISLAANKVHGIRAVVCSEPYSAMMARMHNNANMVSFGARVIGNATAEMIVDAFLTAEYEGGRHQRRVEQLTHIENGEEL